jgi:ABC-type nitrate/sulfonate/bicarbonate transport system ATPase subunit
VIRLSGVRHTYVTQRSGRITETEALADIDLEIPALQFVSVVGASGCGKTTLLRILAGLMRPSSGQVSVDGEPVTGPAPDRAVVFQHAGLYPWRTVAGNVRLGLELCGRANGNIDDVVAVYLELVGLAEFADHYPNQLSGGMQQRVGLARALAVRPSTVLMDEPFGSVDVITRQRLGAELLRIWEHDQRTVVFVTHSLDEALILSDRIVSLKEGAIVNDLRVELPRPRDAEAVVEDPDFLAMRRRLSEFL